MVHAHLLRSRPLKKSTQRYPKTYFNLNSQRQCGPQHHVHPLQARIYSALPHCPGNEAINYNTGETEDGGLDERDGESGEIMRALEKELSKWRGFDDIGWMDEVGP